MNRKLLLFLVVYSILIVGLWVWWVQPDPVHFTGYDEPNYYEEKMSIDTDVQ